MTERTRTEAEKLPLQYAVDQGMEGFAIHDSQGLFTYVNPAEASMYGYEVEELLGKSWSILYEADQIALIEQHYWPILLTRGKWRGDLVGRKKDGQTFNVEVSLTTLKNSHDQFSGLICNCRDIMEQKQIEAALKNSEVRFRTLADSVPILIWETDVAGACTYMNQPWLVFTGQKIEQLLGHEWQNEVHPEDLTRAIQSCERAHQNRQTFQIEYRLKRYDGEYRWFLDRGVPRYTSDGKYTGFIGSCVDMTEQREAMMQREKTYQQLRELTARVEAAKEDERKRIAQDLHDEFGQTLSALNLDLAWIQRKVEGLNDSQTVPTLIEKIQGMTVSIHHAIHAVQQIATSLRPTLLDDLGFFAALEWQIREFQNRTGVTCELMGDSQMTTIETTSDVATALFRITQELFTNIIRHAQASSVHVRFREEAGFAYLEVQDNGIGILLDLHTPATSLGLFGIRERVAVLCGEFTIQKIQETGTVAVVRIPLEPSSHHRAGASHEKNSYR